MEALLACVHLSQEMCFETLPECRLVRVDGPRWLRRRALHQSTRRLHSLALHHTGLHRSSLESRLCWCQCPHCWAVAGPKKQEWHHLHQWSSDQAHYHHFLGNNCPFGSSKVCLLLDWLFLCHIRRHHHFRESHQERKHWLGAVSTDDWATLSAYS